MAPIGGPGASVGEGASARRGRLPGRPGLSARGGARAAEAASSWAERGGLRRGRWAMVWAVRGRALGQHGERRRAREKGKSGLRGEGGPANRLWVGFGFLLSYFYFFSFFYF